MFYRTQVGRVLLKHFWNGDARAFASHNPNKEARYDLFFEQCGDQLRRYGQSSRQTRDNIRACIVLDSLPASLASPPATN